ncbi:hypothetical protein [Paenibacillus polymyxa]|uniref:hypothetical protein n=1 Tax=Paenibacillus polymyxa TaxID=1406 RepID=UPI00287FCAE5|nr:hypothetical protein [Paenibacillus polymyxa]
MPSGANNKYALGGSRLVKRTAIYENVRDGVKIYYRESDHYDGTIMEKFTSEREAALAGYFPGTR